MKSNGCFLILNFNVNIINPITKVDMDRISNIRKKNTYHITLKEKLSQTNLMQHSMWQMQIPNIIQTFEIRHRHDTSILEIHKMRYLDLF